MKNAATVLAALAAGVCTFAFRYLSFDSYSNDHYQHLARAQQMLMGALPVRDFAESGIPLTAAMSAAAQLVFGSGLHAEVIWVASAFALASILFVVAARRLTDSMFLALATVAAIVAAYPVSYSYPKLLPYALTFVAAYWYAENPNWPRMAMLAAAVVVAFLFRHDHGLILGVGAAVLVAVRNWPWRMAAVAEARLLLFGLVLAGPYLFWVQKHGGLAVYVSDEVAMSRREASKAVWAPPSFSLDRSKPFFSPTVQSYRPVINVRWVAGIVTSDRLARERRYGLTRKDRLAPTIWKYEMSRWSYGVLYDIVRDPLIADTNGIQRSEFYLQEPAPGWVERALMILPSPAAGLRPVENGTAMVYYMAWLLPCLAAFLLWRQWTDVPPPARAVVLMAIAVQLLMNQTMLRDPLLTRARDVVAPFALLFPFVVAGMWRLQSSRFRVVGRTIATAILVLTLWGSAAAGSFGERLDETRVRRGWAGMRARAVELQDEMAPPRERTGRIELPIVNYLRACTPDSSRLLTLTFAPELLFFTNRGFAAGHESLVPGFYDTPRHEKLMMARLAVEDVPFVIMDTETEHEMLDGYPLLAEHVRRRYREAARFAVGTEKHLVVLADEWRPRLRTFGDEKLPCFAAAGTSGQRARI